MNTNQYIIFIAFHGNTVFVNAPHCYVIRTLPLEAEWVDPETEAMETEIYLMFRKQNKEKVKCFSNTWITYLYNTDSYRQILLSIALF
jgi:hypothetical protein